MLIVELSDQLGNQMFAYASVKSIAIDLNCDFGLFHKNQKNGICNDTDISYGHDVETIFKNTRTELVEEIPQSFKFFRENTTINCLSAFKKEVYDLSDNTLLAGHYICPKYFEHRIDEVRNWFHFPKEIELFSNKLIDEIRNKTDNKNAKIISVHFRNDHDYRSGGYMLNSNYWFKAAERLKKNLDNESVFVIFYDKKTKLVNNFIKEFHAIEIHNSLVVDMCTIKKCDVHIVCNSSFSIMSALLNPNNPTVIRPSKFYIPNGALPDDVFPSTWKIVHAKRDNLLELKRKLKFAKSFVKKNIKKVLRFNEK